MLLLLGDGLERQEQERQEQERQEQEQHERQEQERRELCCRRLRDNENALVNTVNAAALNWNDRTSMYGGTFNETNLRGRPRE